MVDTRWFATCSTHKNTENIQKHWDGPSCYGYPSVANCATSEHWWLHIGRSCCWCDSVAIRFCTQTRHVTQSFIIVQIVTKKSTQTSRTQIVATGKTQKTKWTCNLFSRPSSGIVCWNLSCRRLALSFGLTEHLSGPKLSQKRHTTNKHLLLVACLNTHRRTNKLFSEERYDTPEATQKGISMRPLVSRTDTSSHWPVWTLWWRQCALEYFKTTCDQRSCCWTVDARVSACWFRHATRMLNTSQTGWHWTRQRDAFTRLMARTIAKVSPQWK